MSYTYTQGVNLYNQAGSATTVVSPTLTALGVGHVVALIVAANVGGTSGATCSVTDNASVSNTYVAGPAVYDAGTTWKLWSFYAVIANSGATALTATFGASYATRSIIVDEYNATGTALDGPGAVAFQNGPGTGANAVTTGNWTTTKDGDLIWGAYWNWDGGGANSGTGFTLRQGGGGNAFGTQDLLQSTHSASTASTWTLITGTNHVFSAGLAFGVSVVQNTKNVTLTSGSFQIITRTVG